MRSGPRFPLVFYAGEKIEKYRNTVPVITLWIIITSRPKIDQKKIKKNPKEIFLIALPEDTAASWGEIFG